MGNALDAISGVLVFLAAGIMPGFYFKSHGILILLQKLTGGAVERIRHSRILIAVGIMAGISCAAAACLVVIGLLVTGVVVAVSRPAAMCNKQAP